MTMTIYHITITMPDGSCGEHHGEYADVWAAYDRADALFPGAARIHVRPVPAAQATPEHDPAPEPDVRRTPRSVDEAWPHGAPMYTGNGQPLALPVLTGTPGPSATLGGAASALAQGARRVLAGLFAGVRSWL